MTGFVLDTFFFSTDGISHEDRIQAIADHFYTERSTAYTRKSWAVERLAKSLFGQVECAQVGVSIAKSE